ncbi:MAG: DUF5615 family PIN-like protein [Chloroflexi bacterium]|nr:DUF5615 family PIN-like protein [Chloroflexota bacterium]
MKFKVDENLPVDVCQLLQQTGYDCMSVHDQKMTGATDDILLTVCQSEGRIMLTLDLDFCDIRRYPPASYPGIIILRLEHQDKEHVVSVLRRIIPSLSSEQIENRLWIVDEHKIRVR